MARAKTKEYTLFGKEVAKALIDKGWENRDLAEALGVSDTYITDILQGKRKATKKKKEMAEILGLNIVLAIKEGLYGL